MPTLLTPIEQEADTALVCEVRQIVDGEYVCDTCGARAVLYMVTAPDGEPGMACWQHAEPWLDLTLRVVRGLRG